MYPNEVNNIVNHYSRLLIVRGKLMNLGLDLGTKNIILCYEKDEKIKYRREVNGFYRLPQDNNFTKNMLVSAGVPYIEMGGHFVALGAKAEEIAHAFNKTLRRPMQEGVLAQGEEDAIEIMAIIVQNLIGFDLADDATLYYCVPAPALNADVNTDFHQRIAQLIINGYQSQSGKKLIGHHINEAHALVLSQPDVGGTAIGISCGAGMINVCYCLFGLPVYSFSLVGSGDWIDVESARQFGYDPKNPEGDYKHTPTSISRIKEEVSLAGMPSDAVKRAIHICYTILMDRIIDGIIDGFKKNEDKARINNEIPVVVAGGTSCPDGFTELFKEQFKKKNPPFKVGEINRPDKPLFAVAEGCLRAAQLHEE